MDRVYRWAPSAGRVLLSVLFLVSGYGKITGFKGTEAYMAAAHMPFVPLMLAGAIAVETLGGLSLLTGWKARYAALVLFAYLIPTTLLFHNFWAVQGAEQQMQMINFLKNLAIMGGLLAVAGRKVEENVPQAAAARRLVSAS